MKTTGFCDKYNCWKIFFITLIVILIILILVLIGLLIYYKFIEKKEEPTPAPTRLRPDHNNKVILVDGKFIRYDPGLYTRPTGYEGVIHHGPRFINLDF
jgi:hypothetical protein